MAKEKNRLSDELKEYGYVFSVKRTLTEYSLMCLGMILLGRFFGLHGDGPFALSGAKRLS